MENARVVSVKEALEWSIPRAHENALRYPGYRSPDFDEDPVESPVPRLIFSPGNGFRLHTTTFFLIYFFVVIISVDE